MSGKTVTFTKKDGTSSTITTQDTVYTHPSTHPASMITGLATVATSGKYSDLSGKPSIPATPDAYVIDTYSSGYSWYRRWSNGFIEQGGRGYVAVSGSGTKITLITPFSNSYYVTTNATENPDDGGRVSLFNHASSYFYARAHEFGASAASYFRWYACGY